MCLPPFAGGWCSNGTVFCFGGVFIPAAEAVQQAVLRCTQHCHPQSCSTAGQLSLMHAHRLWRALVCGLSRWMCVRTRVGHPRSCHFPLI